MSKRMFSLLLALCLIVGLLPNLAVPHTHAEVTSATVKLFGVETTINAGEALYWVDNGTEIPAASTVDAQWNYSFAIVEDVPTVTLRNANYQYNASFIYGNYNGKLKVAYKGENKVYVSENKAASHYFVYFKSTTDGGSNARQLYIEGAENAVLNVTGGDDDVAMLTTANKVYVNITGGTFNIEKTNNGSTTSVVAMGYSRTTIINCNLTVKNNTETK